MTAAPREDPTDAELAIAAAAGDRAALAEIYDRYADRLHDFCIGMLRNRDVAADCVQDTFCTAAASLRQLREPEKLRPWLYSVARNAALRRIRERSREQLSDEVPDLPSADSAPDVLAARTALADLVAEAAGGLSDRDRSVLDLTYYQGLDGPELAEALEVSQPAAMKMVQRLRDTVERSLGALLVARRATKVTDACADLAAVLDGWDGHFTVLMRKRVARHIESCTLCDDERRRQVNPVALLGAAPVFVPAPQWLRDRTLTSVELTSAATSVAQPRDLRRRLFVAAGAAALALGVIVFMAIGRVPDRVPIEPADAEATTTGTGASRPPAGFLAPPPPPPTTTAVDAPSASQAPATIPSASGPATTTPRASSDAPTETDSVTVRESPPARPRPPESASSVVDEPAQGPEEPSTAAPQPSTPQPTAPARTVPREPIKTFTPDTPVVTTIVPIG